MTDQLPYNPLSLENLGASIERAILSRDGESLGTLDQFTGAGIYALYYKGDFGAYEPIAGDQLETPIYVGKAVPAGKRKGTITTGEYRGRALFSRLADHAKSIVQADNLDIDDFACRFLVTSDIWIPLGESLLIQRFSPIWNTVVDGFGNHDPGSGRYNQRKSSWDTLHPGRSWAVKLKKESKMPEAEILLAISEALTTEN